MAKILNDLLCGKYHECKIYLAKCSPNHQVKFDQTRIRVDESWQSGIVTGEISSSRLTK